MLLKYIVSNFKSIGHPVEFSMFPTGENTDSRFLKTINTVCGEWKVLQRGGFFGPNASGKSSFIESIDFARNYIVKGKRAGTVTGIDQFKGNFSDLNGVSVFQFMLYIDGQVYDYGFSLNRKQICEEWLKQLTKDGFTPLFTRKTDIQGKTELSIEEEFEPSRSVQRNLTDVLSISFVDGQTNQLFLNKLHENNVKRIAGVFNWFKHLQLVFPNSTIQRLPIQIQLNDNLREYMARGLNILDTGVSDVSVLTNKITFEEFADNYNIPNAILDELEVTENGIINIHGKAFIFSNGELFQIKFNHELNSETFRFNIEDESAGTQRLVNILPMLFSAKEDNHLIYCVDEIDRSLHTKLSQFLINEFINIAKDGYNQLIFTANDVNLISLNHFREEEIWFIDKNQKGESTLKPLSDFDFNKESDILKDYLNGRFGAVPVIRGAI